LVSTKRILGQLLYGTLFVVGIPGLLVWWAAATEAMVPLPALQSTWAGLALTATGLMLMVAGMGTLTVHGRGLPMNAYPPPAYVHQGIYRLTPHPIYLGFGVGCIGVALWSGSASGLWLVSPMVALGLTAIVLGYERLDLRRRFGHEALHRPSISLPRDVADRPSPWDRLSVYLLVFIPWVIAFEAVFALGVPPDAIVAHFSFEQRWPVLQWTEAIYASTYVFVLATPLILLTNTALRRFAVTGLIATATVTLVYLAVPLIAPPRPFIPDTFLGRLLMLERTTANTVAAFPAFHLIWSLLAADAWSTRSRAWGMVGWLWAALIAVSCLTTGMHALVDLVAAMAAFLVVRQYRLIGRLALRAAEAIANSWREWRWGGFRFINYGLYAAAAASGAFWISTTLGGPDVFWQLVWVYLCGLVGAGLWAQKLEGSSKLSRPFGYYGGVVGGVAGALLAGLFAGNTITLMALIAMASPWIQGVGRLRCLVQGCCHGSPAPEHLGIRYRMPRSRVCVLGGLEGVPLYPTPLYSIAGNVVIGVVILRLWSLGVAYGVIAGVYLILAGMARFVEESYRGEPQTPAVGGLHIYHWTALLSIAGGILLTVLPGGFAPGLVFTLDLRVAVGGVLYGALVGFAMGADFPGSTRRFARLAAP
jgi:protein-S-isoprenylcysteine O-methyltransferase Ste14